MMNDDDDVARLGSEHTTNGYTREETRIAS